MCRDTVAACLLAAGGMILLAAGTATGAVIGVQNPSFETGDLTGWTTAGSGTCGVMDEAATDGNYFVEQHADDGLWAEISQKFIVPPDTEYMSVDIGTLLINKSTQTACLSIVGDPAHQIDFLSGKWGQLASRWKRYVVEIPPLFQGRYVELSFAVAGDEGTAEQWVDNVTFMPEPACLTLLALGGLAVLRRRRPVRPG